MNMKTLQFKLAGIRRKIKSIRGHQEKDKSAIFPPFVNLFTQTTLKVCLWWWCLPIHGPLRLLSSFHSSLIIDFFEYFYFIRIHNIKPFRLIFQTPSILLPLFIKMQKIEEKINNFFPLFFMPFVIFADYWIYPHFRKNSFGNIKKDFLSLTNILHFIFFLNFSSLF